MSPAIFILAVAVGASTPEPGAVAATAQRSIAHGEFERALEELDEAVAHVTDPGQTAQLHVLRAQCFFALHRNDKARSALQRALEADPGIEVNEDRLAPELVTLFKSVRGTLAGELLVKVVGAKAQVSIDGNEVGEAPVIRAVPLGRHLVQVASAEGAGNLQREVLVGTGGAQLTFNFREVATSPAAVPAQVTALPAPARAPEPGFGGIVVGARGEVEVLGRAFAPTVFGELSQRWVGVSVAVIAGSTFGGRVEARAYPLTVGAHLRPYLAAGATFFPSAVAVRGAAGAAVQFGHLQIIADAAYERFLAASPQYLSDAVLIGVGAGWRF